MTKTQITKHISLNVTCRFTTLRFFAFITLVGMGIYFAGPSYTPSKIMTIALLSFVLTCDFNNNTNDGETHD